MNGRRRSTAGESAFFIQACSVAWFNVRQTYVLLQGCCNFPSLSVPFSISFSLFIPFPNSLLFPLSFSLALDGFSSLSSSAG